LDRWKRLVAAMVKPPSGNSTARIALIGDFMVVSLTGGSFRLLPRVELNDERPLRR